VRQFGEILDTILSAFECQRAAEAERPPALDAAAQ
jgi:hypothetical protein